MRAEVSPTIRLADYQPPAHLVDDVELVFHLNPTATKVVSRIAFRPNPDRDGTHDLTLDGSGLTLLSARIDGQDVPQNAMVQDGETLTVSQDILPDGPFTWTAEVEINPEANTSLEGLYMSKGMFSTQCEAEGFRKITYYPDRPDVMATFTVSIYGEAPVLLSNGNLIEAQDGFAKWHDPWPKPAYLFALVAGDLKSYDDTFTTMSGRAVELQIYVRPGDETRCAYAMDALKRSMKWDEDEYGREYDLDLFMIVAVDDFNAGAMENKGLNIFNSKYVLASPETATDRDYELIEGIIAHEYFHNWTGNRVTCRDWFQLCLKEGLTVFRDQQFSASQRSAPVKRIDDVAALRARQFREDAGPLAHPVRPDHYKEINNFYTATVYEKGAEVIGMLRQLVGADAYRHALDLYFDRHDGQACTIEDWLKVFEDSTGRDLAQFALWYSQAGTPTVTATPIYDGGQLRLTLTQDTAPTPGQPDKSPRVIPLAYGFLSKGGETLGSDGVLELTEASQSFVFDLDEEPVLSLNRNFSAPITLKLDQSDEDLALLLAHDSDAFNRWEAGQKLSMDALCRAATGSETASDLFLDALATLATDADADPAFRSLVLNLPGEAEIAATLAERGTVPDPDAIHTGRNSVLNDLAHRLGDDLKAVFEAMDTPGPYTPDAKDAGRRSLKSTMLGLISRIESACETALAQFDGADNMTESLSALGLLVQHGKGDAALKTFHERWRNDVNVTDKWFSIQAARTAPGRALEVVTDLTGHADFTWKNPNRFRSLMASFGGANHAGFHRADGAGYRLFTDWVLKLDPLNPQTAARMTTVFEAWPRYDQDRRALMKAQLERMAATDGLSRDSSEMVTRLLQA